MPDNCGIDESQLKKKQYLVLLTLPESVKGLIQPLVRELEKKYCFKNMKPVYHSHITLLAGHHFAGYRNEIVKKLKILTRETSPFLVEINGFLEWQHFICLKVESGRGSVNILAGQNQKLPSAVLRHPRYTRIPHITLLRDLKRDEAELIGRECRQITFSCSFTASSIILLERDYLSQQPYQLIEKIPFSAQSARYGKQISIFDS